MCEILNKYIDFIKSIRFKLNQKLLPFKRNDSGERLMDLLIFDFDNYKIDLEVLDNSFIRRGGEYRQLKTTNVTTLNQETYEEKLVELFKTEKTNDSYVFIEKNPMI
jgi:hypothetical protein